MATSDRRAREQAARQRLIVDTARAIAEAEGWDAVTTRRLSTEIEYSQPVLYKHFAGKDQIAEAIAIEGFRELTDALHADRTSAETADGALTRMARAYLDFACANPVLYELMFVRRTTLTFANEATPPPVSAGFVELREVISSVARDRDPETLTEVFWAALHGLASLASSGRLRPDFAAQRVKLLVEQFSGSQR